jgi:hypothetical protein
MQAVIIPIEEDQIVLSAVEGKDIEGVCEDKFQAYISKSGKLSIKSYTNHSTLVQAAQLLLEQSYKSTSSKSD